MSLEAGGSAAEEHSAGEFPSVRARRLRISAPMRRLVSEVRTSPADLVLPLFVKEDLREPRQISSMPGVVQHTVDSARRAAHDAVRVGLGGLMLFAIPAHRDEIGSGATDPAGALNVAVRDIVAEVGDDIVVMADLCLDEFTSHGHCGVLSQDGSVANDATLQRYREMGTALAAAGAHVLGTSGMMDGQVAAVRRALDEADYSDTSILAYAAKYASAFYGPFRDAVESTLAGDRRTYQQDPANRREAMREVRIDIAEGADIVMVKPGMPYLDVIADVAAMSEVPVAAYQVSGEYSMIEAAAQRGWIDRNTAIVESVTALRRAGADIVVTYWAQELAVGLLD